MRHPHLRLSVVLVVLSVACRPVGPPPPDPAELARRAEELRAVEEAAAAFDRTMSQQLDADQLEAAEKTLADFRRDWGWHPTAVYRADTRARDLSARQAAAAERAAAEKRAKAAEERRRAALAAGVGRPVTAEEMHAFYRRCEAFYRSWPVLPIDPYTSPELAIVRQCNIDSEEYRLGFEDPDSRAIICRACDMYGAHAPTTCFIAAELGCEKGPFQREREKAVRELRRW